MFYPLLRFFNCVESTKIACTCMLAHYLGKYACISIGNGLVLRVYPFTSLITCMSTFENSNDPGQLASLEARLIWVLIDFFISVAPYVSNLSKLTYNNYMVGGARWLMISWLQHLIAINLRITVAQLVTYVTVF